MKKVIALFLALIMMFTMTTVAFATDVEGTTPGTEVTGPVDGGEGDAEAEGGLEWILDLPFWTVGPMLKFAGIALKLVTFFVKVASFFGLIDAGDIISQIVEMIQNAQNGEEAPEEAPAPDVTDEAALAA